MKLFKKKHKKDLKNDKRAIQKLRREVERVKRVLSSQHSARLEVDSLYDGVDFSETLTRARFEDLNIDLFKKTLGPVGKVMSDGGLSKSELDGACGAGALGVHGGCADCSCHVSRP